MADMFVQGPKPGGGFQFPNRVASREAVYISVEKMLTYGGRAKAIAEIGEQDMERAGDLLNELEHEVEAWLTKDAKGAWVPSPEGNDEMEVVDILRGWRELAESFGDDVEACMIHFETYGRTGVIPMLDADQGFADGTKRLRALERIRG